MIKKVMYISEEAMKKLVTMVNNENMGSIGEFWDIDTFVERLIQEYQEKNKR